jgi:putative tricarboxylic transport membrane protein
MGSAEKDRDAAAGRTWPLQCCSRRGGLVASGVLAIVGAWFATEALTLTFGNLDLPGPGFFPFALGLLLIALSVAIFIAAIRQRDDAPRIELGHIPVLITLAAMVLTAFLFERLGAILSLGAFSIAMLVLVAGARIVPAVLSSAAGMLAVWYLFKVLLGLQLPLGPLAGLL